MKSEKPKPQRWWDFPAAILLLAALVTSATRLVSTRWAEDLSSAQTLVFFGLLAGFGLGKSSFSPKTVRYFAFLYTGFFITWQLGISLSETELLWSDRVGILLNRVGSVFAQLFSGHPVEDSILFLSLMYLLYWLLALHAGYILVRYGNAWQSVLPAGLALFVIHTYDPLVSQRAWFLAVYLFFTLALVGRMTYLQRSSRWRQSRTSLPPHIGLEFIRFTLFAATFLVIFAWTAPALANALPAAQRAWMPVARLWEQTADSLNDFFAPLRATIGIATETYGPSALLGRGSKLSSMQIFRVTPPPDAPSPLRFYWRARTYDTYNNGQWYSTINTRQAYDPDDNDLAFPQEQGRWSGSFLFTTATHVSTLFTAPQPIWVNQSGHVEFALNPDTSMDVSLFRADPSLNPGSVYYVQSAVSIATIAQLKSAGSLYPAWVTERYLQIPESITPRVFQLAEDITIGLVNPYDKVMAVTNYLRNNITYIESLDRNPPFNQETIDWFLFDYRKGFCNYYSSAEIILLRILGIPARWAVGYAQGESISTGDFIVRHLDSHSWPEVYFPGYGWVEFEPTVSQPPIERLPGDLEPGISNSNDPVEDPKERMTPEELEAQRREREETSPQTEEDKNNLVVYSLIILGVLGGMLFLAWRYRERIRFRLAPIMIESAMLRAGIKPPHFIHLWSLLATLPPLSKAYLEINRALARLRNPPDVNHTPIERATSLAMILPPAEAAAYQLVAEYQAETFGNQVGNLEVAQQAAKVIRKLSFRERFHQFFKRFLENPETKRNYPRQGR